MTIWIMTALLSASPAGHRFSMGADSSWELKVSGKGGSVKAKNWWSDRERQKTGHLFAADETERFLKTEMKGGL